MFIPKGGIAQLGERGLCKPEARGSNPLTSTNIFESLATAGLFHIQRGSMGFEPRLGRGAEQTRERLPRSAQGGAAAAAERAREARDEPLTSTKILKASLRRGFFMPRGSTGLKGPPYRKTRPKRRWYPPSRHHSICYDETSEHLGGLHARC